MASEPLNTPREEELRLALVMNGGVSLAIWIGGVSHEINRFVGETHPVYRGLLELTSTRARVDVISGTSAGGINGAALALSCVYDTSLYTLRDLWLAKGSFGDLLRDPSVKDPPSLLDGDGYFLPALEKAFSKLVKKTPRPPASAPMDVALTATMLHAEPNQRLDDLGESIEDCHHRASFHFSRGTSPDPFATPNALASTLAQAARASASFPVAFEPRLFTNTSFSNAITAKQAMYDRYLIDGGVLDNKPLRAALKAIFSMPATRTVRRVLAYVVPDPAVTAMAKSDTAETPPPMTEVAFASLLGIPAAQSIADQLQQIDDHNAEVRRRRHSFGWLAANVSADELESLASGLFTAYRERRIDGLLDYALEQIESGVLPGTGEPGGIAFGRRTHEWLKALWRETPRCDDVWKGRIPNAGDAWGFDLTTSSPSKWNWGLYTLEGVGSAVLELLRRTQRLNHLAGVHRDHEVVNGPPIPAVPAAVPDETSNAEPVDWDLQDSTLRNTPPDQTPDEAADAKTPLGSLWSRAYALLAKLAAARQMRPDKAKLPKLVVLLQELDQAAAEPTEGAPSALRGQLLNWLVDFIAPAAGDEVTRQQYAALARELVDIVRDLKDPLEGLLSTAAKVQRPEESLALSELNQLYELLLADNPDANVLMRRLLQLEVIHYSMAGQTDTIDAAVELVQISGRGASPWGGPETPATKLTGMQLGHFGAFYRKSWRANDWMMGRLDGINRIVRVALNPDRLHRLYAGRQVQPDHRVLSAVEYVMTFLRALAIDTAAPEHRKLLEAQWQEAGVKQELAFLENPAARSPEFLPLCADALTRRLHLEVLCKELPFVASSVEDDTASGAVPGKYGATLVSRVRWDLGPWRQFRDGAQIVRMVLQRQFRVVARAALGPGRLPVFMSPDAAISAFANCPVGSELLSQELGSDLMTRTASQAVSVAHGAAVGARSGLANVGDALKVLTLPVKFFYLLANRLARDSRTSAAVATTLLVAGVLFVVGAALLKKPPDGLALVGWSMLIGWFGTMLARQMGLGAVLAVIALAVIWVLTLHGGGIAAAIGVTAFIGVLIVAPTWVGATIGAVAALWWSTHHPAMADVGAALCSGPLSWTSCHVQGTAENAKDFVGALGPLVVVMVLGVFAYFGTRRRG